MTTVINTPAKESSGTGVVIGILLVVFLAILFLMFGLPYLRNGGTAQPDASATLNVDIPGGNDGAAGGAAQ